MTQFFWLRTFVVFLLSTIITVTAYASKIVEFTIKGAIGPATADYLVRGIAQAQHATLILIQMDTPGGLDQSTRQIVQAILHSKVPVVTYVAPVGARAASAGTFILYASTIAAMAPGTHLGAASPVTFSTGMGETDKGNGSKTVMNKKMINDTVAYIRSLAQLRGRDAVFAEKAVLNAETLTANEALKNKIIDMIAVNEQALFTQLNGLVVTQDGQKIQLATENVPLERLTPDWRTRFLQVITDPNIAYLLFILGVYGIFFELVSPGFVLPGVIGAIAMLIALYALQLLPVNYAGLGLIVLGLAFIVAEAFTQSFGILGLGGTVAFIIGSVFLLQSDQQNYQIAWSIIYAMAAVNIFILLSLLIMAVKSRKRKVQHGVEMLLGAEGRTLDNIDPSGQAVIKGEIWSIHANEPIAADKRVKVIAVSGLQLEVEELKSDV
ncbi:NfeD family protein [Legionella fairfieldensis]|uniref:NfeD family protein n=1 Tax=Legionella fairfieldensis TaxID=45064 RepID=UPI00048FDAFF|nr:nodulation protein NfeD [Legionella fairfieldensis]